MVSALTARNGDIENETAETNRETWQQARTKARPKARLWENDRKGANSLDDNKYKEPEGEKEFVCLGLGSLDLSPFTPHTHEMMKINLDTGAAVTAFPLKEGQELDVTGNGNTYLTAGGESIKDSGGLQIGGRDEKANWRRIKGRLTPIHKALGSASQISKDGRQDIWIWGDGGCLMPRDGPIARGLLREYQK